MAFGDKKSKEGKGGQGSGSRGANEAFSGGSSGGGDSGGPDDRTNPQTPEEEKRLMNAFGWLGAISPVGAAAKGITKAVDWTNSKLREIWGDEKYNRIMEQGVKDEAAREAGRNEKADLERDRKIIPPSLYPENLALYGKPSPGPVTSGTPSFGGAPGAMGSPTVKKKKLLGG